MSSLAEGAIFLLAAVLVVPLFRKLGLGAVLGYLAAGLVIGPDGLGLIYDVDNILHFAELGIVFLLFIIGLELQPSRLWALRKPVFGMGGAQVALSALPIGLAAWALGVTPLSAAIVGLALAMSSTAFALQTLAERNQLMTQHGRASFSILLFQDVAVIPLLAIIPLLATTGTDLNDAGMLWPIVRAIGLIALVIIGGHYLLRPLFRMVSAAGNHELFTAAALLVVVGTALLMDWAGLSMALGSFLAGVLMADSEFRHELSAQIEPFKGLLLGLFFIAVGMSVDLQLITHQPALVIGLALALVAVKFMVLYGLGYWRLGDVTCARKLALTLSQGGEFAFVLFAAAVQADTLAATLSDLLIMVVTLSMALTPVLLYIDDRIAGRRERREQTMTYDSIDEEENPVVIAGFGRFGQIVGRVLRMKGIHFTALDKSLDQLNFVRRFGNKVYYGDATRLELLRAAKLDQARLLVIAIDDMEDSLKTAELARRHFPQVKVLARARNRVHSYRLKELGVDPVIRELLFSSLELTRHVLTGLGIPPARADEAVERFRAHDDQLMERQQQFYHDEEQLIESAKQASQELRDLFDQDAWAEDSQRASDPQSGRD
ncbi:potassium transporter KefB [Candidatus Tenderia electrophaga]|mgnify:CR=1 FL=1|jgi:glutathione-regulated potassium-efflux system ancillary protein KefC/glutathione-regulated potassium-efflux system protein KefB|uniref:Potassium transporter KefB n=1 Tax=Candidatus Tenderia electrophaga TaxID=1748243 RepID=A0A0S2TCV7_9GAMM|nr:potassium transporter KefB [Candidatus Tenderia electrophaga]